MPQSRRARTPIEDPLLSKLNVAQRKAVTTTEGPVLVLAGAGTGKTRVITFRVAHLLRKGVPPEAILAVTFTNKAAREMRERVGEILGREPAGLVLSTFHSFGARILRKEAAALGYRPNFNILDTADQLAFLRTILQEVRGAASPRAILGAISRAKSRFALPGEVLDAAGSDAEELVGLVYERYQEQLQAMNCVDFDDLILLPVTVLRRHEEIRARYQSRFRHLLVDEYQDTNASQYELLRLLVGPERNLCVVGDDDQSIYGFRGADRDKILAFERDFPGARVVKLEENYRSTESILKLANAIIAGSASRHKKTLVSRLGKGAPVRWVEASDDAAEVDHVLGEVQRLLWSGTPPASIAILIRAAVQARPFEEKLRLRRIPYTLIGGQSYYDRKEVRDVIAYWMAAANRRNDFALLRIINVPPRGFGSATIRRLRDLAAQRKVPILEALRLAAHEDFSPAQKSAAEHLCGLFDRASDRLKKRQFSAMARGIVEEAGYDEVLAQLYPDPLTRSNRRAAVDELLRSVESWEKEQGDFLDFLEALALSQEDPREKPQGGLSLMTLHGAKGLEFRHVFLVGAEDDIIPHRKAQAEGDKAIEEERRLFYVGITRAREALSISHARARTVQGRLRPAEPSRFLLEVAGKGLLDREVYDPHREATDDDVEEALATYRSLRKPAPSRPQT